MLFKSSGQIPRIIAVVILTVAMAGALTWAPSSRATLQSTGSPFTKSKRTLNEFVPGDVLVRYKSEKVAERQASVRALRTFAGQELAIQVERFEGSDLVPGLRIARVAPDQTLAAIAALKNQPDVLYAEPNYIMHADLTPNDPRYTSNEMYGLNKIGAPTAWDTNTGSATVVVGVIDQGIDFSHPDLTANRFVNPFPGSIAPEPGFPPITGDVNGYNFIDNNGTVFSGNLSEDHASHVGGTIGAVGNNSIGITGVNWNVRLMSLKFINFQTGSGDTFRAIRACDYARRMLQLYQQSGGTQGANVRVLNNSYGGGAFQNSFLDAINALNAAGILFVAAAGNSSQTDPAADNDVVSHYPSNYNAPNVIAVANTTSSDTLSSDSHFGANSVHLGAPGTAILSTIPDDEYEFISGTSTAAPHVSGAAALLLAQNPSLTVARLKNLLILNGDVLPSLVGNTITGRRLNVGKSMQALLENDVTPPNAVSNLHINSQNGRSFNLGWTPSGDDNSDGVAALYELSFTDAQTGVVMPLKTIVPPAPSTDSVPVALPFRHRLGTFTVRVFDNVGNEGPSASLPVSASFEDADPYATTVSKSVPLSTGGTGLPTLSDDDRLLENYTLPFSFPYFGTNYAEITAISTNGNIYFSPPPHRQDPTEADDVPSTTADLTSFRMISGLWDDLDLSTSLRADAGVYVVQPSSDRVIFRWQGVTFNLTSGNNGSCLGQPPIDFEIELRSDGTIKSRYGSTNCEVWPVVGISGGAPDAYVIPSHTSEDSPISLAGAVEVTYIPRNIINPLDENYFFVSQQYRDLLGREADLGGLQFWAEDQLNPCGVDQICLVNRRTGVSAAFFVENEFQRTGSFVYRSFKGGLGRRPTFAEFSSDRPLIVEGPNLEQTKQAYSLAFVQRAEFIAKYSTANSPESFVDALIASILTNSQINLIGLRQSLIDTYNNTAGDQNQKRSSTLRAAIDSTAFTNGEYNASFVLMQYFGYLIRDPDQGGYDFWLGLLNTSQQGNYRGMVCSFITSTEYQERFSNLVPHSNVDCGNLDNPGL